MSKTTAFIFPGQGSQKVGMLSDFYSNEIFINTFAEASDVLAYDLLKLAQEGPQEQMNLTEKTQPLLLCSSVAMWRIWQSLGGAAPAQMAGHSLGEWSALVCADVVNFADAIALVRARGQYMQEAVPVGKGAMAAIIGIDNDEVVEKICAEASASGEVCAAVNYNSPGQLVIAGDKAAVEKAMEACKAAGAKRSLPLPVSAPFHTSLMKPAADRLAEQIATTTFNTPEIPVVHNVHARSEKDAQAIKNIMVEQIYSPVRWVACVNTLREAGVQQTVECGAGKVLSGLIKRIQKDLENFNTDDQGALEQAIAATK